MGDLKRTLFPFTTAGTTDVVYVACTRSTQHTAPEGISGKNKDRTFHTWAEAGSRKASYLWRYRWYSLNPCLPINHTVLLSLFFFSHPFITCVSRHSLHCKFLMSAPVAPSPPPPPGLYTQPWLGVLVSSVFSQAGGFRLIRVMNSAHKCHVPRDPSHFWPSCSVSKSFWCQDFMSLNVSFFKISDLNWLQIVYMQMMK